MLVQVKLNVQLHPGDFNVPSIRGFNVVLAYEIFWILSIVDNIVADKLAISVLGTNKSTMIMMATVSPASSKLTYGSSNEVTGTLVAVR